MSILVSCSCGKQYQFGDSLAGKTVSCSCGLTIQVPRGRSAAPAPATTAVQRQPSAPRPAAADGPQRRGAQPARPAAAAEDRGKWPMVAGIGCAGAALLLTLCLGGGALLLRHGGRATAGPAAEEAYLPFPELPHERKAYSGMVALAVNRKGDGRGRMTLTLDEKGYSGFKNISNPTSFMRRVGGLGKPNWEEIRDLEVKSDDATRTITANWLQRGAARAVDADRWEIEMDDGKELTIIEVRGDEVIFNASTDVGGVEKPLHQTVHVLPPPGSRALRVMNGRAGVEYRTPEAPAHEGRHPSGDFLFEAQPHLMGCLAKLYANPKFNDLWTARAVFTNTGDQTLYDYSVRFRIEGFTSDWSSPRAAARVPPGGMAVDPYYPVLSIGEVLKLDGEREARVEAEYSYRRTNGGPLETHKKTERLKILSRNQAAYSSIPKEDQLTWHDRFGNVPRFLPAMCTYEDPAIQQVAGMVSKLAGGQNFSGDPDAAMLFMRALYEFMARNLTYQTPPGGAVEGVFTQHVKYGRDVLRNKSGTCIDLAIFYATVCEAVGLEPLLYVIPGHCFPAVRLPGGSVLAVEATCIGGRSFQHACQAGKRHFEEGEVMAGRIFRVDVAAEHNHGVERVDLGPLGGGPSEWGIVAERRVVGNAGP